MAILSTEKKSQPLQELFKNGFTAKESTDLDDLLEKLKKEIFEIHTITLLPTPKDLYLSTFTDVVYPRVQILLEKITNFENFLDAADGLALANHKKLTDSLSTLYAAPSSIYRKYFNLLVDRYFQILSITTASANFSELYKNNLDSLCLFYKSLKEAEEVAISPQSSIILSELSEAIREQLLINLISFLTTNITKTPTTYHNIASTIDRISAFIQTVAMHDNIQFICYTGENSANKETVIDALIKNLDPFTKNISTAVQTYTASTQRSPEKASEYLVNISKINKALENLQMVIAQTNNSNDSSLAEQALSALCQKLQWDMARITFDDISRQEVALLATNTSTQPSKLAISQSAEKTATSHSNPNRIWSAAKKPMQLAKKSCANVKKGYVISQKQLEFNKQTNVKMIREIFDDHQSSTTDYPNRTQLEKDKKALKEAVACMFLTFNNHKTKVSDAFPDITNAISSNPDFQQFLTAK